MALRKDYRRSWLNQVEEYESKDGYIEVRKDLLVDIIEKALDRDRKWYAVRENEELDRLIVKKKLISRKVRERLLREHIKSMTPKTKI